MANNLNNISASVSLRLTFQDIPQEVLLKILTFLDVEGLIAFSSLSRYFRDVYQQATLIVYRAALLEAGMMDISDSSTSLSFNIPSKLALLKQRREVWRTLQMMYRYDPRARENVAQPLYVKIDFSTSSIYDFSAGVYVLGERRTSYRDTGAVRFLDLSAVCAEGEVLRKVVEARGLHFGKNIKAFPHNWPSVKVSNEERIVDFGLSLREHDLIALITETPSQDGFAVTMHLRQLSTGQDHPLARVPSIYLRTTRRRGGLAIMLEVSGPNLVLLLTTSRHIPSEEERDWLAVYNWYTGEQITATTSRPGTWQGFVFLTDEHILLPNAHTATLDIIKLSKHPSANVAIPAGVVPMPDMFTKLLSLRLPRLLPGIRVSSVLCRSEPNPFGVSHPDAGKYRLSLRRGEDAFCNRARGEKHHYIKGTPLAASPETSIILIRFYMEEQLTARRFVHTLFVHRASIVDVLRDHRVAASQAVPGPIGTEESPEDERDIFTFPELGPGAFNVVIVPPAAPAAQGDANAGQVAEPAVQENMQQVNPEDLLEMAELINPDGAQGGEAFEEVEMIVDEGESDESDIDELDDDNALEANGHLNGDEDGHDDADEMLEDVEVVEEEDTDMDEDEADSDNEGDFGQFGIPANFVQIISRRVADLRRRQAEALNRLSSGDSAEGFAADGAAVASNSRDVPWSAWGPDSTRWTPEHLAHSHWVTTTCGQRAVLENEQQLIVWDFNPYSVRRERHRERERMKDAMKLVVGTMVLEKDGEPRQNQDDRMLEGGTMLEEAREEEEEEEGHDVSICVMDQPNELRSSRSMPTFCEPVVSKLPYVEATTPRSTTYVYTHGVMLDEDQVVGINPEENRTAVEVYSV